MSWWWTALFAGLLGAGSQEGRSVLKSGTQPYEVTIPAGYVRMSADQLPEPVYRSYEHRYQRQEQEEWAVARLCLDGTRDLNTFPPFADPESLSALVYAPARSKTPPERIQAASSRRKIGVYDVQVTEVTWNQDLPFFAQGALIETKPRPIRIFVGGPTTLEPQIREEFRAMLADIRIPTEFLSPEEVHGWMAWGSRAGYAGLGLGVAYLLVWVFLFRRDDGQTRWIQAAWLAAVAGLWIADLVLGFHITPSVRALELPMPGIMRLGLSGSLSAVFTLLALIRIAKRQSAFTWA